jgi:hypothetical protein
MERTLNFIKMVEIGMTFKVLGKAQASQNLIFNLSRKCQGCFTTLTKRLQ